jgi:hypothetical protein
MSEEKNKGGRPPLTAEEKALRLAEREEAAVAANRAENDLFIGHAWAALSRPPVNLNDPTEVEQRVTEYALSCRASGLRPNPPALAAWLGITSDDLSTWLTGVGTEEQKRTAARIYQFLHQSFADTALAGKIPSATVVFLAKNWFGYSDAVRLETASTVERKKSLDELAKEAAALPDGDIIDAKVKDVKKGKK